MSNKTLAQIIQNNIRVKNLEAESGSGDIVIYDNESGTNSITDIALEIGAIYDIYITSAFNSQTEEQYGQQKVTIKLIPIELSPNNYDFFTPVHYVDTSYFVITSGYIGISNYGNELWSVNCTVNIKIYQIIKKAV